MMRPTTLATAPDHLPVLSRGRHRNPRAGGCFMEFASYLAGERWSDHPRCTHPQLAHLARLVNDVMDDDERPRLVHLIPDVVGANSAHPLVPLAVAAETAAVALPVARESRQRALAAGMLSIREVALIVAPAGDERRADDLVALVDEALATAPLAVEWAHRFRAGLRVTGRHLDVDGMTSKLVEFAVLGIAEAATPDVIERLERALERGIAVTRAFEAVDDASGHGGASTGRDAGERAGLSGRARLVPLRPAR